MNQPVIKYFLMFVVLLIVQVLFLNQIQFSGYVNPIIYILFVMLLPVSTPQWAMLVLGFLMGIGVDIFSNTPGVHSFATVLAAYARSGIIRVITPREDDMSPYPGLAQNGWGWFLTYSFLMVLLHHTALFFIEVFTFAHFFDTFLRILLSALFSIFVIVLSQFIIFRE